MGPILGAEGSSARNNGPKLLISQMRKLGATDLSRVTESDYFKENNTFCFLKHQLLSLIYYPKKRSLKPEERHCCKSFEFCKERRSPRGYLKRNTVHPVPEQLCPGHTPPAQHYGTGGSAAGAATPWSPDVAEGSD